MSRILTDVESYRLLLRQLGEAQALNIKAAAELGQLRRKVAYAAAFLDALAERLHVSATKGHEPTDELVVGAAADCRALARKLRGEP